MFSDIIHSDNHVHTYFSTDSDTPMEDMLKNAIEKEFSSICFTDHMDYNFPSEGDTPEFLLDIEPYFEEMKRLSEKYGDRIKIRRGIELGLKKDCLDKCISLTEEYPFDFVIGSSHVVHGIDPYYPKYYERRSEKTAYREYFESILENLNTYSDFDVYGHLDYVVRYGPDRNRFYTYEAYADIIDEILRKLISMGKGIEVNTAGFKYGLGHPNPTEAVLLRYHELGGEILTLGADAHAPEHVAYAFDRLPQILRHAGFRYFTVFTGRKPDFLPLPE